MKINIIGAGLAGSEAAYQCLKAGFKVNLYEMRPTKLTPAHTSGKFGELVCSNSLRSNDIHNAVGLLKEEMRRLDSLIMKAADQSSVPAGSALAVDRDQFSNIIEETLMSFDKFNKIEEEVTVIPEGLTILASGPLTSDSLAKSLLDFLDEEGLHFYDAIAPVINIESVDMSKVYRKSRYDKGTSDYLNCPMTKEEFFNFYHELINAKTVELRDFEDEKVFEGCMPIEVMAKRGIKTLTFGPLKPVGLEQDGQKPYAVVQLRQDNAAGTLYNLVGFQTHLTWGEQKRLLRMIPGLENVEIERYGVMHRNTYINSPLHLNHHYQVIKKPDLYIAGQLSGVEGYVESAASGLVAALYAIQSSDDKVELPQSTMMASMAHYVSSTSSKHFQPMNANFGILRSNHKKKEDKVNQALEDLDGFIQTFRQLFD